MKRHVHLKGPQRIVKGVSRPPANAPITSGNPVREAPLNTVISSAPLVDVMSDEGIDLLQAVQGAYRTDALFRDILDNLKQYQNFKEEDSLLFTITQDRHLL